MVSTECELAGVMWGQLIEQILSPTHSRWTASLQCECVDGFSAGMGNRILSHNPHISMVSPWCWPQCDCVGGFPDGMDNWILYRSPHISMVSPYSQSPCVSPGWTVSWSPVQTQNTFTIFLTVTGAILFPGCETDQNSLHWNTLTRVSLGAFYTHTSEGFSTDWI